MTFRLLLCLVWVCLIGCASDDEGPAAVSEQCCPVVRLCEACTCDDLAQRAADADDSQGCVQALPRVEGCLDEVRGSAERTCAASGSRPDVEVSSDIVGDWFMCLDDECTQLDARGMRYTADGRVFELSFVQQRFRGEVTPPRRDGEPYCVVGEQGSYSYDRASGELTLTLLGMSQPSMSSFLVRGDYSSRNSLRVRENATGTWIETADGFNCDVSNASPLDPP
jgi:hypothetical protein